jgi:hypothetical protein
MFFASSAASPFMTTATSRRRLGTGGFGYFWRHKSNSWQPERLTEKQEEKESFLNWMPDQVRHDGRKVKIGWKVKK